MISVVVRIYALANDAEDVDSIDDTIPGYPESLGIGMLGARLTALRGSGFFVHPPAGTVPHTPESFGACRQPPQGARPNTMEVDVMGNVFTKRSGREVSVTPQRNRFHTRQRVSVRTSATRACVADHSVGRHAESEIYHAMLPLISGHPPEGKICCLPGDSRLDACVPGIPDT